ncbi:hypothetical protein D6853_06900 [Butyrivibrio sp. X503]|uniref:hypothetical protein n=1 Tax=Butyrivibrio sp. X503 TaxID=2364878 RepID=UPI000EA8D13F|nr:hypothetical protein [Butyrivibrio sp. X503]RKM56509.1 hypothetical protein D6853_06900 [Butyrivibrio sp. X503]
MDIDDKKSDISAYNIYNRMLNSKDGDIWNTMVEYNENASDGTINESKEFLERLGNGDAEKGMKKLKKQLNKTSIGTDIISKDVDEEKIKETKDDFLKHVSNESGVDIG